MDSLDDINHQITHAFIDELELITPGKLNASKGSPY